MLTFENETDNINYLSTSGFNIYKEEGFCSGVECSSLSNQNDCVNQYGCYWDNGICIVYPCSSYNQEEQCDALSSCFWDDDGVSGFLLSLYYDYY